MIIERMTFNLKYGREEDSAAIWKETVKHFEQVGNQRDFHARFYSCNNGRVSRIVQDLMMKSINDHNPMMYYWSINPRVQELYRQFTDLCDSGSRDMYKIEHEVGKITNFENTIMERYAFHLHFGKARDSIAIWKEIIDEAGQTGGPHLRMLTDIVGQSYTLLVEASYVNQADIKPKIPFWKNNEKMNSLHQKFIPLCQMAEKEFYFVDVDL